MRADVIIVGAGLAGSLAAIAISDARPEAEILLLDQRDGPSLGHTWSFHLPDVSEEWRARLTPYLRAEWDRQTVKFPQYSRTLATSYASLDGAGLASAVAARNVRLRWNARVAEMDGQSVRLADNTVITADCVIDARGFVRTPFAVHGWQKFVGLEYECDRPHGVDAPLIMDATVPQIDGYRFIYLLPFSPTRLLIEDTRYSDEHHLDADSIETLVGAYADSHGWRGEVCRKETGVLPIALAFDAEGFWNAASGRGVPIGMRAELFHAITGYSLPVAAEVATVLAENSLTSARAFAAVKTYALRKNRDDRYFRLLNRMFFHGCPPERRYRLMQRFYRFKVPLIERFYAGKSTIADKLRIVTGKPPIPLREALKCVDERTLLEGDS